MKNRLVVAAFVTWPITAAAQVWTPTTTVGAPAGRDSHTAVWTGSKMIVWGGSGSVSGNAIDTGGVYDPANDTWSALSTTGAPLARRGHAALWTGSKMIVWGGWTTAFPPDLASGGVYDPESDAWKPTSSTLAPSPRESFTALWTGSKMLVWGGVFNTGIPSTSVVLGDGAAYDPASDTWTPISMVGAPAPRFRHSAVWTGSRMIVWGGTRSFLPFDGINAGAIYDPASDTWTPMSAFGSPGPRDGHAAVWAGSRMVIWGGVDSAKMAYVTTGGIYDPVTDTWTATSDRGAPVNGPGTPLYTALTANAEMIVWGGLVGAAGGLTNTGGILDLASNSWTPTAQTNAPSERFGHSAVWTGARMIVWGGGVSNDETNTGGLYDPQGVSAHQTDYYTVPPCRVVDTRDPLLGGPNPLDAGTNRSFALVSACGIPGTAQAVSLNVTVTQATAAGDLRLYPLGTMLPVASAINFGGGQTRANNAVASLGDGGALGVHVDQGSGTVHLIIDVNGYFQ